MENNEYKKFLAPSEKLIQVFGYSKPQFIWDLVWGILFIPAFFIGIVLILISLYRKLTIKYFVTDKRVIIKKGLIGQSTVSASYSQISDVTVTQGILGRLVLHTGTIVINTAGTDLAEITMDWVENPFETKNIIYEQMHKK